MGGPIWKKDSGGAGPDSDVMEFLAGQDVRFRWHTSTDGLTSGPFGWVLDDVRLYTCANEPQPLTVVVILHGLGRDVDEEADDV